MIKIRKCVTTVVIAFVEKIIMDVMDYADTAKDVGKVSKTN